MSYTKILLHCVWGTKRREPVLTKEIRSLLIDHIKENARTKNIFIDTINGHTEHLHAIVSLGASQNISEVMQLIKGEAAFWINNKTTLLTPKFEWADEYFAVLLVNRNWIKSEPILKTRRSITRSKPFSRNMMNL